LVLFTDTALKNTSNLARNQAEIGGAHRDIDRRKPVLNFVKQTRRPLFGWVNFGIIGPDRLNDIIPLLKLFQKPRDHFRGVLHIAIHQDRCVPITMIQAGN
jgi:hypothetical protein